MGIVFSHEEARAGEGIGVNIEDNCFCDFEYEIVDEEDANKYMDQITLDRSPPEFWIDRSLGEYYLPDPDELDKINRSLAFHRIRAYELSKGNNMDDEKLKQEYPPDTFKEMQYYVKYEKDFDWTFHFEYCNLAGLDDYQRLIPNLQQPSEYNSWNEYHQIFSDYASDKEFVEYSKEIAKKIMWLNDYIHVPSKSPRWRKLHDKAYIQAMKIATGYPRIFPFLVWTGFKDFVWSLRSHYELRGVWQSVYFEIWKRLAKQKKSLRDATKEVYEANMFPLYSDRLYHELKIGQETDYSMEQQISTYMVGIQEKDLDDEVHEKIKKAVEYSIPKIEGYQQYAELKIAIAERIGLVPQCMFVTRNFINSKVETSYINIK